MKEIKFYVIGGQYEPYCYGGTPTLIGAKRLAGKHKEYHDNFGGWHTPAIYKAEDCIKVIARGYITHSDGEEIIIPKDFAEPVC